MKAVFNKTLMNNVYTVEVTTTEIEETDIDLFSDFGEPSINIGGEIKDNLAAIVATLPNNFRKVSTQLPVTIRFSEAQYGASAKTIAEAWILTIEGRMNAEMTTLRAKLDDFSGASEIII